jgi:S-adenosylmethionine decarboxylase
MAAIRPAFRSPVAPGAAEALWKEACICYRSRSMKTLGRHLLCEFYGCDRGPLDDVEAVAAILRAAAHEVGATIVAEAFHRYAPHGVSGTLLIAESHLSLHTWPEHGYVAVDIFTCGGLDPRPGFALIAARLGARSTRAHEIARGLPEELERELVPGDVTLISEVAPLVRAADGRLSGR